MGINSLLAYWVYNTISKTLQLLLGKSFGGHLGNGPRQLFSEYNSHVQMITFQCQITKTFCLQIASLGLITHIDLTNVNVHSRVI